MPARPARSWQRDGAQRLLGGVCLEQGRWFNNNEFPGDKQEWELLSQQKWSAEPNIRKSPEDYPLAVDDSDLHPLMIGGVGGSSLLYGAQWMRLLPSDFRMYSLDGVGDDWPLTYDDLAPYYDKIDRAIGVSGVEGDPMYPPGMVPPLPPHPIGKIGRRAATGMNKLGWHWWPAPNAIASQRVGDLARCARIGTCETGCPEGAKASFDLTHWPSAIKHGAQLKTHCRVRKITTDARGPRRRRDLLRRRRHRTPTEGSPCRVGGQRNWHSATAAAVGARRCPRRTCELLRLGRKAPDAAPQR